jgi:hypothetical protein
MELFARCEGRGYFLRRSEASVVESSGDLSRGGVMGKFTERQARPSVGPMSTVRPMPTHEGGYGYERDAKSELFLLAAANMVGERTFYEDPRARDPRYVSLIHQVTKADPAWMAQLVPFLRERMLMRSASVVMAAEYVAAGGPGGRKVVAESLQRPDEPAEMLAYWMAEHGRSVPKPVKRGVADAVTRMYTEKAALKYDGTGRAWRMGDVIELVHPKPKAPWQGALYRWLLDRRRRVVETPKELAIIRGVEAWEKAGYPLPLPEGVTWERLSSTRPMDRRAWEAVIPQMGLMALTRNLRNFDEVGISHAAVGLVMDRLRDAEEVRRSRQLPIRFYSAWKALGSLRWGTHLEHALVQSLSNVPELPGRTLILVDLSGSMFSGMSDRSKVERWELAAVFGTALALRCEQANLVWFSNESGEVPIRPSVLRMVEGMGNLGGGGTYTFHALQRHFNDHDRIVILTDEQAHDAGDFQLPDVPIYTFNLAGYRPAHLADDVKGRYTFGGLSDAAFLLLPILEARRRGEWPHLVKAAA